MNPWPLILPHADAQRVARGASCLVLTCAAKPGPRTVQDALAVARNTRYVAAGRRDMQESPDVAEIEVIAVMELMLMELTLAIVRASGFKTQRDFFDDWYQRRRWIDPAQLVRVCEIRRIEPVRMLHRRVHRGYTTDPRLAAHGEPSALSAADLARYADTARWRDDLERRRVAHDRRISRRRRAA